LQAYVDELEERLAMGIRRAVDRRRERLQHVRLRDPRQRITDGRLRLDDLTDRLIAGAKTGVANQRNAIQQLAGRLDAMSPLKVLERGYTVVTDGTRAITHAKDVSAGDAVRIRFQDGERGAVIAD
jgi:exodeoxyribonuclease VII large subunit